MIYDISTWKYLIVGLYSCTGEKTKHLIHITNFCDWGKTFSKFRIIGAEK
jgi:hypothetical protein